jgi:hypothetical protein
MSEKVAKTTKKIKQAKPVNTPLMLATFNKAKRGVCFIAESCCAGNTSFASTSLVSFCLEFVVFLALAM